MDNMSKEEIALELVKLSLPKNGNDQNLPAELYVKILKQVYEAEKKLQTDKSVIA